MPKHLCTFGIILVIASCICLASDWPQYLGPSRNAISSETGISRTWPDGGPEVLWTVPLGEGFGGAAVSEGKVYVLDRVNDAQDVLRCLDLESGKEEWTFSYDAPGKVSHPGSRSVPTIEGNYIYICGSFGHVHCIDKRTHRVIWQKNIWSDFNGGDVPRWAISQNPLIFQDSLILASQTERAGLVAYHKRTGEVQWTSPALPGKPGYVSPTLVTIEGEKHAVMIPADGAVVGMDPKSGTLLWSYDGWECRIPVPNVTEIGDGRIFITGGYRAGSAMIKVEKEAGTFRARELWTTDEFGTHVHPAVLHQGHLYGHCSTNETKDGMVCMDLEGNVQWKTKRSPLFDKGGFVLVDGLFISVDGSKGILHLIEPSPQGYKELARAKLLDTQKCWGPLALSGGKLLIRDQKQMRCVVVG